MASGGGFELGKNDLLILAVVGGALVLGLGGGTAAIGNSLPNTTKELVLPIRDLTGPIGQGIGDILDLPGDIIRGVGGWIGAGGWSSWI